MIGDEANPLKISTLTTLNLCRGKWIFLNPQKIEPSPCARPTPPSNLVALVRRIKAQGAPPTTPVVPGAGRGKETS